MLTFLNTLVNVDKSVPTSVLTLTQGDVNNLFMAGQCAMMINGPWQIPGIKASADVTFKWDVSGWPYKVQPTSILGGENFAIGAGTHVQEAWDVMWDRMSISRGIPQPSYVAEESGEKLKDMIARIDAGHARLIKEFDAYNPDVLIIIGAFIFFWSLAYMTGSLDIFFGPLLNFLPFTNRGAPPAGIPVTNF